MSIQMYRYRQKYRPGIYIGIGWTHIGPSLVTEHDVQQKTAKAAVTGYCMGDMFKEATMLLPTVLECPTEWCNHGEGGARWSTQPLTENIAMEMVFMVNSTEEVVGQFVMVGVVELFVMVGIQVDFLSGPGQAPVSKRYRAQ
jgi:hypothetical protein